MQSALVKMAILQSMIHVKVILVKHINKGYFVQITKFLAKPLLVMYS